MPVCQSPSLYRAGLKIGGILRRLLKRFPDLYRRLVNKGEMMNKRSILMLSFIALTLAACGRVAEPTPEDQTAIPPESPVGKSPLSPPPTPIPQEQTSPLPDPATSPIEPPSEAMDDVVPAAKEYLAAELDAAVDDMEATLVEPKMWRDASLGCPEPGKVYAQVVTPGYRIVLEVDGEQYQLHTDQSGRSITMCEKELQQAPAAAVDHLASELGIPPEEIQVRSVEAAEWPDASLGCPEPGKAYAQVVTPGYRVILSAQGERYELHTDREGRAVVICDSVR